MENIEVKDVVAILIKDPNVIRHKLRLCLELGFSQTDYHQLELRYTINAITAYGLFLEVISKWVSLQETSLLSSFLDVLVKCDFINVAGKTY
jgi:hypothetical protein